MEAKIYVGTYGKYNGGSIKGEWLDLTKYANKKAFVKACKKLHKGEHDPEYMYQDYEGILTDMPKDWIGESHLSDIVFEFIAAYKDDEEKGEAFLNWKSHTGYTGELDYLIGLFDEAYEGKYDSEKAYAEYLAGEMGYYAAMKKAGLNECYFDEEAYARDLFMGDYFYSDGVVYRNI
jgi:antirestriction protein